MFSHKCELLREVYASQLFEMFLDSYKPSGLGLFMDRYIFTIGNPYIIEVLKLFCDNWPPSIKKFLLQLCKNSYGHSIMKHAGEDVSKKIFESARVDVIKTLSRARVLSSEQITPMEILMMIYVSYVNESAQSAYDKGESIYRWEFEDRTRDWLNHSNLKHVQMFQLEDDNKPFNMNEFSFESFLHKISLDSDEYQSQNTIMQSQHPLHHEGFRIYERKVVNFYAKYLKENGINLDNTSDDSTSENTMQSDEDEIFTKTHQRTKHSTTKSNTNLIQQSKKEKNPKLVKKNQKRHNDNKTLTRIAAKSVFTNKSIDSVPNETVNKNNNDEEINNENQDNESTDVPKEIVVTEKKKNDKMTNESDHDEISVELERQETERNDNEKNICGSNTSVSNASVVSNKNSTNKKRNEEIFNDDEDETSIIDNNISEKKELQDNDSDDDRESTEFEFQCTHNSDNSKCTDDNSPSNKSISVKKNTMKKDAVMNDNDKKKQEKNHIEKHENVLEKCNEMMKNSNDSNIDQDTIDSNKKDNNEFDSDLNLPQKRHSNNLVDHNQNNTIPMKRQRKSDPIISVQKLDKKIGCSTEEEDEFCNHSSDISEDEDENQQKNLRRIVTQMTSTEKETFSTGEDIVQVFMGLIHKNSYKKISKDESLLLFSLVKEFREITKNKKVTRENETILIEKHYGKDVCNSYKSILKEDSNTD